MTDDERARARELRIRILTMLQYEGEHAILAYGRDERRRVWEEAAELACNQCLCPADVAYDNSLPHQTQGDSYNDACLWIMDKLRQRATEEQP